MDLFSLVYLLLSDIVRLNIVQRYPMQSAFLIDKIKYLKLNTGNNFVPE